LLEATEFYHDPVGKATGEFHEFGTTTTVLTETQTEAGTVITFENGNETTTTDGTSTGIEEIGTITAFD
jgi:hypothetical protein